MKLENKIKQEFQNREIKPSNNSWEVLNAQLEVASTKKENKKWRFWAYAVIFIGLLFSLVVFLNINKVNDNQYIIVDIDPIKINKPINIKENLIKEKDSKIVKVIIKKPVIQSKKQKTNNKPYIEIANVSKKEKVVLGDKKINIQNRINELITINNKPSKIIKKQNKTQISENQRNLRETKTTNQKKKLFSTDADIDLMLANALNKNRKNRIQKVNIQSTYLQYVVENEINTPIGNKILKTLKAGVDTVEEYITSNN